LAKKKKTIKVTKADAAERVKKIWPILRKTYPQAKVALKYTNALELLIATILSAQCTDVRVNMVTKKVFRKYKNLQDWAGADIKELENDIRSTGFYRNKALNIKNCCAMIINDFNGKVPDTMEELLKLPGVGRKTANVLLGNVFNTPGIVCDTHVIRLSRRLGLSGFPFSKKIGKWGSSGKTNDAVKLEFSLMEIVPKKNWTAFSNLLIFHGRNICTARKPDCLNCPLAKYCPSANKPELW